MKRYLTQRSAGSRRRLRTGSLAQTEQRIDCFPDRNRLDHDGIKRRLELVQCKPKVWRA